MSKAARSVEHSMSEKAVATEVEFVDPPEVKTFRRGRDIQGALKVARTRPGSWARIAVGLTPETAYVTASRIRGGTRYGAFGKFEATTSPAGDGTHELFVRYIGHMSGSSRTEGARL